MHATLLVDTCFDLGLGYDNANTDQIGTERMWG